jgi:hypothetical protein
VIAYSPPLLCDFQDAHFIEWFEIAQNFLKLAFAGDHREAKCP